MSVLNQLDDRGRVGCSRQLRKCVTTQPSAVHCHRLLTGGVCPGPPMACIAHARCELRKTMALRRDESSKRS